MRRWLEVWNAYWFPQADTRPLALARILVIGIHLVWFLPAFASLPEQINLLEKNRDFIQPQAVISAIAAVFPREVFFTPEVFTALWLVTLVAGVLAVVGFFTRTSLFMLALGSLGIYAVLSFPSRAPILDRHRTRGNPLPRELARHVADRQPVPAARASSRM